MGVVYACNTLMAPYASMPWLDKLSLVSWMCHSVVLVSFHLCFVLCEVNSRETVRQREHMKMKQAVCLHMLTFSLQLEASYKRFHGCQMLERFFHQVNQQLRLTIHSQQYISSRPLFASEAGSGRASFSTKAYHQKKKNVKVLRSNHLKQRNVMV